MNIDHNILQVSLEHVEFPAWKSLLRVWMYAIILGRSQNVSKEGFIGLISIMRDGGGKGGVRVISRKRRSVWFITNNSVGKSERKNNRKLATEIWAFTFFPPCIQFCQRKAEWFRNCLVHKIIIDCHIEHVELMELLCNTHLYCSI